jgi:hypothetical protein
MPPLSHLPVVPIRVTQVSVVDQGIVEDIGRPARDNSAAAGTQDHRKDGIVIAIGVRDITESMAGVSDGIKKGLTSCSDMVLIFVNVTSL